MNPKLKDAIAIFKELGWEKATSGNVLDLPQGTPEQQKTALDGLKSGPLGDFVSGGKYIQWKRHFNVSLDRLILFAIRIGVTPARAKTILSRVWDKNFDDAKINVIIARGEKFASSLIDAWYKNNTEGIWSDIPVRLVHNLDLALPQSIGYFHDWASVAYQLLISHINHRWTDPEGKWLTHAMIHPRFAEHIHAGLAVNTPLTLNFGQVAIHGIKHGMINRETTLPHIFAALDAAIRPADRKALLKILDELNITDQELVDRTQALIPILATSDTAVINRLAPPLIAHADDELLPEIMLSAFSATTKKTRLLVLKSAQNRPAPPGAEEIAPWLIMLAADKDKAVATTAKKLIQAWDIEEDQPEAVETAIQGLWQETPPLWKVPDFEPGEITQSNLTDCLAVIYERKDPGTVHDIATERLLTIATALAYTNPEEVRIALAGLKTSEWWGSLLLHDLNTWAKSQRIEKPGWSSRNPLIYRDRFVISNLGKIPCLLSAPSKIDLTITVPDMANRLALYQKLDIPVIDSDLFIAITRLDIETKTPEAIKQLQSIKAKVKKPNDGLLKKVLVLVNAADMVLKYINDPTADIGPTGENQWVNDGNMPKSLALFRQHLPDNEVYAMFPLWGDTALKCISWREGKSHITGLELRQIARRRNPLPPGGAINMLGAQRSSSPQAAEDTAMAVLEAWERGLLHPGIPDVSLLDWRKEGPPTNLAALATALEGLARDGMLSLIWPILDKLIEESLIEQRLLSGTSELAETIEEFLPEVLHAIKAGKTDNSALNLPGILELAARGGTSKAVTAAKKIAAQLPAQPTPKKAPANKPAPEMKIPFDKIWPKPNTDTSIIEDGIDVKIVSRNNVNDFIYTLTLPGITDNVFYMRNIWPYDLENYGECTAFITDPATSEPDYRTAVYLRWDNTQQVMTVNNESVTNASPKKARPKHPISILTIVIAAIAKDQYTYDLEFAKKLIKKDGNINPPVVKRAMETILQNPAISPGKLARCMEKELHLLPALWPVLTESIKFAGEKIAEGEKPPIWANRILDITMKYSAYLSEAAKRGYIPPQDAKWQGLSDIAEARVKSTAVAKAGMLLGLLQLI
ncbi:MAG: hypothetical protein FWC77_02955 [Defluviitaleaceae bacterium]|nr:hypothetical protein [Defluviitaleaceae bacterium]